MALTKRAIDAFRYDDDGSPAQILWDRDLPGFGIRVFASGAKSFIIDYRRDGRKRRVTIGRYGVLTPDQARKKATRQLGKILEGSDPAEERRQTRAAGTLRDFADTYIDEHAKLKKTTWREDRRRLDKYIVPALGGHRLASVTRADVERLHRQIGRKARFEANRVLALVSILYTVAKQLGHIPETCINPANGVEQFDEGDGRRRYVKPEELPILWTAIASEQSPYARAFFVLALLLGCRRSELLRARWENVDLERATLTLPKTKAGNTHEVPLSKEAVAVFEGLPRMLGNPHVFPSPTEPGKAMRDVKRQWRRIRDTTAVELWVSANAARAGELHAEATAAAADDGDAGDVADRFRALVIGEMRATSSNPFDVRLHDLRRTVGSWLVNAGATLPQIGAVLNHADPSTTAIYARLADNTIRKALDGHATAIYAVATAKKKA